MNGDEETCIHWRFVSRLHCYIDVAGTLSVRRTSHVYHVFLQRCNIIAILSLYINLTSYVKVIKLINAFGLLESCFSLHGGSARRPVVWLFGPVKDGRWILSTEQALCLLNS